MLEQLVGQSLDRYQLVEILGEGGMGAVFKGRDITLQRDVAIKVMQPQAARLPNFQERFLNEARTAARLDHPGIVKVFDFGQSRGYLYIVMELLRGDNLRKLIEDMRASGQSLPLPEAVHLVRQVCQALDYAHQQGILHRDIKPDNIMLKLEPNEGLPFRPVLTDLGLAKLLEGAQLTVDGTSMGTPAYMSPEQALGEKTDARSDVYSVGILLYELTVGQLPFPIKTLTEAIRYHTKEAPPPPRSLRSDIPEPLERAILTAIAKNPAERYPNAGAMAQALATALPGATVTPTMAAAPTLAGESGLLTQYQQTVGRPRGQSILAEFPQAAAEAGQDRISILFPDGTVRSVHMPGSELTIGRDASNILVLDFGNVSRQHARITFDGTEYKVTDLNSTNGTYLANVKLLPGVPEAWTPDKALRIGDCWLRLERAARAVATATAAAAGTIVGGPGSGGAAPQRVAAFMDTSDLAVDPGATVSVGVTILNQGTVVDHFQVSVVNLPANWIPATPPLIRLLPGAQQVVSISIAPPRVPQSRAGVYPFTIRVASQDAPDQVVEVPARLTVHPYAQFTAELHPQAFRAGQPARVMVNNQGNTLQTFAITWQDRADELNFHPPKAQLTVPEGQVGAIAYRAKPKRWRLFGGALNHPFTARIAPQSGEAMTASGEVTSRGLIPKWLPPLIIVPLLALCVAAVLFLTRKPVIRSVTIDPPNPTAGQPFTIHWQVENARTIELRPLVSGLDASAGAYTFPNGLPASTSFTLVAQNRFGSAEQAVQIAVLPAPTAAIAPSPTPTPSPTPEPGAPVVEEFTITPMVATPGQVVTISWRVTNAEEVSITPFGAVGLTGELQDAPTASTQYVLVATNQGKQVERVLALTVQEPEPTTPADPPQIVAFTADPPSVVQGAGGTITLAWEVQGADSVSIEPGLGNVEAAGTRTLAAPATTTQYTLAATNGAGTVQQQIEVQVLPPVAPEATNTPVPGPTWQHPIVLNANRVIYNLRVVQPGVIKAQATWSGSQGQLALIINRSGATGAFARQDGNSGVQVTYNVTEADLEGSETWRVTIASFGNGMASGNIKIEYPSGSSVTPFSAGFQLSPDTASACSVVVTHRLVLTSDYYVEARANWTGAPKLRLSVTSAASPAAHSDGLGPSPLGVRHNVAGSDSSVGDTWVVWLTSTSAVNAEGTMELYFPYIFIGRIIVPKLEVVPHP